MNKYNLALIPVSKSKEVILLANKLSHIADQYLLNDKSLPHITLYQFLSNEHEIDIIWKKICSIWQEKSNVFIFEKFSYITFDNLIYWISLLPDNCYFLHKMHRMIANILQFPEKTAFDPHMTLLNTINKKSKFEMDKILPTYTPIKDSFILSLGKSDDIGQLKEIIYIIE